MGYADSANNVTPVKDLTAGDIIKSELAGAGNAIANAAVGAANLLISIGDIGGNAELIGRVKPFTPESNYFGERGAATADGLMAVTGATSLGSAAAGLAEKGAVSTGRTIPLSLKEKLAMEEVKANPLGVTPPRMPKMSDTKNGLRAEDGWVKRTQNVNGVEIHYVQNVRTGQIVDFKFKN